MDRFIFNTSQGTCSRLKLKKRKLIDIFIHHKMIVAKKIQSQNEEMFKY